MFGDTRYISGVCGGGVAVWCVLWVCGAALRWLKWGPPRYLLLVGHFVLWFPILLFNATLTRGGTLSWPGKSPSTGSLQYHLEITSNTAFFLHVLLLWLLHHYRPPLIPTLVDSWLFLQTVLTLRNHPVTAFNFLKVYRLTYHATLSCNVISCVWRLSPTRVKVYLLSAVRYFSGLALAGGLLQVLEVLGGADPIPVYRYMYQLTMLVPGLLGGTAWFMVQTRPGQVAMFVLVPFCISWSIMSCREMAAPLVDLWHSRMRPPYPSPYPRLLILGDVTPDALLHCLDHYVPEHIPRPDSDVLILTERNLKTVESMTAAHGNIWVCEGSSRDTHLLLQLLKPRREGQQRSGDVALILNRAGRGDGLLADDAAIFAVHQVLVVAPRTRVVVEVTLDQTETTLEAVTGWREHGGSVLRP